jgi:chromosome segregation ATPase
MSIFDAIEKLITEHGSAAVLRERLDQAKDQHVTLEREYATVKNERDEVQKQLQEAGSRIDVLTKEKAELEKKIEGIERRKSPQPKKQIIIARGW